MKSIRKKKIFRWLTILLIILNLITLIFYWAGNLKNQFMNDPREFLSKKLIFTDRQKNEYFILAKEHNHNAIQIREEIKKRKENLFHLLKSDQVSDSERNDAASKVSQSIQSLDILTFEHFRKVRAMCTEVQKPKFDSLLEQMFNSVGSQQKGQRPQLKL
jgi:protein CpxP